MNKIFNLYNMTDEREAKLWKDAIFVFDTSFLLDFYNFPIVQRQDIFENIFEKIKNRLWIPAHVQYEYLRNREAVISKPIKNQLEPLEKDIKLIKESIEGLNSSINKNISKKINLLKEKTSKSEKHTYINSEYFDDYTTQINMIIQHNSKALNEVVHIEKKILYEIESSRIAIENVEENDDVLEAIEKYFEVGREFTFDEVIKITKEGKHRYEFKIPPGYGDYYRKEKKGTQIFGDLIIWKQILEYAKDKKLPIIFITNDTRKDDDWCTTHSRGRIKPREELVKEIYDFSGVEFWMYESTSFLHKANKYLDLDLDLDLRKTFDKILWLLDISKETIEYIEEKDIFLIDSIINEMLMRINSKELKIENNLQQYRQSIQTHFKWIVEHIDNDYNTNFDDYRLNDLSTFYFEYCNFYKTAKDYIKTVDVRKEVKENLEDYFSFLEKFYCDEETLS